MKIKTTALMLAAALLAGTFAPAFAGEEPPKPKADREIARERGGPRRGPGGPGREWRRDRDRDEWRHERGPRHDRHGRHGWCGRDEGPGFGRGPGGRGRHGRLGPSHRDFGGFGPHFMADLELDEAQKTKLVDVMTENFRAGMLARMEVMEARKKLEAVERDDNSTPEAIIAANTELGTAKGKLFAAKHKAKADIKGILTPEQAEKLEKRRMGPPPRPFRDDDDDDDGPDWRRRPAPPFRGPGPRR